MRALHLKSRPSGHGFVLVGVVMFVLALTILGLSLYGLSTYEGQFFADTQGEEQALYQAEGGISLVQELLRNPPYQLSQSHQAEGYENIVRATAWQMNPLADSTSVMDWNRSVFIRVRTRVGTQFRIVEAEFTPSERRSPYKRLFTAVTSISYTTPDAGGHSRTRSTELRGPIWQPVHAPGDTAWLASVDWETGQPMLTEDVPAPDVDGFMALHYASTPDTAQYADSLFGRHTIRLDAGSDAALRFFHSPPKTAASQVTDVASHYQFFCHAELELEVRGTAVWMAPGGIRFNNRVTIKEVHGAHQPPTLVIVTQPNGTDMEFGGDYRDVGLWFYDQGLHVEDGVRVVLVSSGHVRLEVADYDAGGGSPYDFRLPYLNVFADEITMMGPHRDDGDMDLTYPASMDALMDALVARGALPSAAGSATGSFTMVPGTWRLP